MTNKRELIDPKMMTRFMAEAIMAGNDYRRRVMDDFLKRHADKIVGVVSGFDRMIFRGRYGRSVIAEAWTVF